MSAGTWFVDASRAAVNWGTAVSGGTAAINIYRLVVDTSGLHETTYLWREVGAAASAGDVTAAQAATTGGSVPAPLLPGSPVAPGGTGVGTTGLADGAVTLAKLATGVQTSIGKADGSAQKTSNLSDIASASTSRTNLGLGTAATMTPTTIAADTALTGTYAQRAGGTSAPAAPLPFLNVRDFGAKGDGTTDDTTAIQAAAAALTAGARLVFPQGAYVVTGTTTLTVPCTVEGASAGDNVSSADVGTVILNKNGTASPFSCSVSSIRFRDLYFISYQSAATVTSNQCVAITFTAGYRHIVERCTFVGWYKHLWFQNCGSWTVRDSYFSAHAKYGIHIQNVAAPDTGDPVLSGNTFVSNSPWNPDAHVRQESAGGAKVIGNKFLSNSVGATIGYDLAVADGATTSILVITGNSFETSTQSLIRITQAGPSYTGNFNRVNITGNQMTCTTLSGPGIDIRGMGSSNTAIKEIVVASNTMVGTGSVPSSFVSIVNASMVSVSANQFYNGQVGVYIDQTASNVSVDNSNNYFSVTTPVSGPKTAQVNNLAQGGTLTIDPPPVQTVVATPATTGGSIPAGTYYYRIAYFDGSTGVGQASKEVAAVVGGSGSGSVTLTWTAWPTSGFAATSRARIYRGTTPGGQVEFQNVIGGSFTDTGAGWSAGTVVGASNFFAVQLAPSNPLSVSSSWIYTGGNLGINTKFPNSILDLQGSLGIRRVTAGSNYTVLSNDFLVAVTNVATSPPRTITLPSAASIGTRLYVVKDETGAAATNNIVIATTSSQTIDGASTYTISTNWGGVKLYSDGTNWHVLP